MGTNNSVDPRTAEQIAESKRIADQRAAFRKTWEASGNTFDEWAARNPNTLRDYKGNRTDSEMYSYLQSEWNKTFEAAWKAPGRQAAESQRAGAEFAAAAKPDKTDTYLRGIGIKRRTGSMQNSFIGRAFDPSAPIGRGNLLGD